MESLAIEKNKIIFLHRMVQEVLNNVVKHSGADHVSIHIFRKNEEVHIIVKDNGKGFTKKGPEFKAGIGLSSIRQRASMIGAKAEITSEPGSGTTVNFSFK